MCVYTQASRKKHKKKPKPVPGETHKPQPPEAAGLEGALEEVYLVPAPSVFSVLLGCSQGCDSPLPGPSAAKLCLTACPETTEPMTMDEIP